MQQFIYWWQICDLDHLKEVLRNCRKQNGHNMINKENNQGLSRILLMNRAKGDTFALKQRFKWWHNAMYANANEIFCIYLFIYVFHMMYVSDVNKFNILKFFSKQALVWISYFVCTLYSPVPRFHHVNLSSNMMPKNNFIIINLGRFI